MDYIVILLLTFVLSVLAVIVFWVFMAVRGKSKGNITYWIIQSYLGNKKPIELKGRVSVDDGDHMAIFKLFDGGEEKEIGSFHQKYLLPFGRGYCMLLEQYEIGRFRPIELSGDIEDDSNIITEKDFLGQIVKDKGGNPLKTTLLGKKRVFHPVPNDDVDWIIRSRDRLKEKLLKKALRQSFWKKLAAALIWVMLFMSIFINSYYNFQTSEKLSETVEGQSEAKVAELVTKTIMYVLMNQTVKDVVRPINQLPPNPG